MNYGNWQGLCARSVPELMFIIFVWLHGDTAYDRALALAEMLPDHEFEIRRHLVADIFMAEIQEKSDHVSCHIEALLLDS